MTSSWLKLLRAAVLSVVAIAAIACGPSLAQQESAKACHDQCGLDLAGCLESRTCLAIDGQIIPCEEECQAEHDTCQEGCAGD